MSRSRLLLTFHPTGLPPYFRNPGLSTTRVVYLSGGAKQCGREGHREHVLAAVGLTTWMTPPKRNL
ncbi:hypothetical protein [Kibdelosporangium philippinense]|uniref:hypothetical protein n=1 Tax=Kibdelosporangium philippinense TaxID=211113 RepID=UPI003615EA41